MQQLLDVQYTRENLSYMADLLKFLQYTVVHLSTFLFEGGEGDIAICEKSPAGLR